MKTINKIILTLVMIVLSVGMKAQSNSFSENFNQTSTANPLPTGWDGTSDYVAGASGKNNSYLWRSAALTKTTNHEAGNGRCAALTANNNYTIKSRLKSPVIALSPTKYAKLQFKLRNATTAGSMGDFSVYISTDSGATYQNNPIVQHISTGNVWTDYEYSLAQFIGQNIVLVFEGASSGSSTTYYYFLDNVQISDAPSCQNPIDLMVSSITNQSAYLYWNLDSRYGSIPSSYQIELKENTGTTVFDTTGYVTTDNSITFSNLTSNSTYTARVMSDCSVEHKGTSDWQEVSFTTSASASAPPLFVSFDSLTSLPAGSLSRNVSLFTASASTTSLVYGGSGKSIRLSSSVSDYSYFVLPPVDLTVDSFEVDFKIKCSNGTTTPSSPAQFKAGYVTDISDIGSTFVPIIIDSVEDGGDWKSVFFNGNSMGDTSRPVYFCINVEAGNVSNLYVDNIDLHILPSCRRPEELSANNPTSNSITLNWNTVSSSTVECKATATDGTTVTDTATGTPFVLGGLMSNTVYSVTARALCGTNDSSRWSPSIEVRTQCQAITPTALAEDFEDVAFNTAPECWRMGWLTKPAGTTIESPFSVTTQRAHSGAKAMSFVAQASGAESYLSSPKMSFAQNGRYDLSVWVYRKNIPTHANERIEVWATPQENSTVGGTLIGTCHSHYLTGEAEDAPGWYNYQYNVTVQGDYHITFVCYGEEGSIEFDDVEVVPAPACRNVKHLKKRGVGIHDISLVWTASGSETQWIVDYQIYEQTAGDSTLMVRDTSETVSAASIQIGGLTASTLYDIEATVRALCPTSDTAEGVHLSLASVETRCEPLAALPYLTSFETSDQNGTGANPLPQCWSRLNNSQGDNFYPYNYLSSSYARNGSQSLYFNARRQGTSSNPDYQIAVLPAVDTSLYSVNQLKIRFSAKNTATESSSYPMVSVGVMSDPDDASTFVLVENVYITGATYSDYAVTMTDYSGSGIYPAFMVVSGSADAQFVIDDARIEVNNNCNDITSGVTVLDVKSNSVSVRIIDNTVTEWQVSCCTGGEMPDSGIVVRVSGGLDTTVYGLTAETSYTVYVRRVCGTEYGSWSVGESFRTKCPSIRTYPFAEDFESHEVGWLGGCYDVTSYSSAELKVMQQLSGAVMGEIYNHTPNGTKGLMCSDPSSPGLYYPSSGIFKISRIFHLKPGKQYRFSLWAKRFEYYSNYTWKFVVKYGLDEANMTTGGSFTVSNTTFEQFQTLISVAVEEDYYITIETTSGDNNTQYYPQIDDVLVEEFTCAEAGELVVGNLQQDSVTLGYTATDSLWQFTLSADSTRIDGRFANPVYTDTSTANMITVGGLQPNRDYYCLARNICGAGDTSEWSSMEVIHTKCLAKPLPHSDSFERESEFTCWTMIDAGGNNAVFARSNAKCVAGYSSLKFSNCIAVTPEYEVDSLTHCFMRGWILSERDNASVNIQVMTDPDDAATSSDQIATLTLSEKNRWYEFVIYFDTLSSSDFEDNRYSRYVSFESMSNTIYLDSVVVETVGSCPMPYNGEISNVTENSFDISFTEHGTASEWTVYANGESYTITDNPSTVFGLSPATDYNIKIASSCSATSISYPFDCGSIRTLCGVYSLPWSTSFEQNENYTSLSYNEGELEEKCWITYGVKAGGSAYPYYYMTNEYSVTGNQSLYLHNNANSTSGELYLVLPNLSGTTNNLRWKLKYRNSSLSAPVLQMGYMSNFTDSSTFVVLSTLPATTQWTTAEILTSSYTSVPSTARLVLRMHRVTSGGGVFIDDISVSQPRSCTDTDLPIINAITDTKVTVSIADTCSTHNHWQYCVGEIADDISTLTPTNVYTDSFDVTGLTADTDYYIYVRAVCGANDYSNWSRRSFTTECVPVTLTAGIPFVDSFEDEPTNIPLEGCYSVDGFYSNNLCVKPYPNPSGYDIPRTGNVCLYSVANNYYTPNGVTIYRKFNLEKGKTYRAGIYAITKSCASDVSVLVGRDTTSMTVISKRTIDQHSAVNNSYRDFWEYLGNYFVADTTGVYYIAVRGFFSGANTSSYIYYDDFTVEELSGCIPPIATIVSSTTSSVTFALNDTLTTSVFEYRIEREGEEVVPATSVTSNIITVNGLSSSSTFTLDVRRDCGGESYSDWYSATFSTECDVVSSFPFTEDFEGDFPPLCWTITAPDTATWTRYSSASTGFTSSGSGSAHLTSHAVGDYALLSTPEILLNGNREYVLSFKSYLNPLGTDKDKTLVYLSATATSIDNATLLTTPNVTRETGRGMYDVSYEIPEGTNGRYYVIFKGEENTASYLTYCYIDDVSLEMLPECSSLDGVEVVRVSSTTITVNAQTKSEHSAVRYTCTQSGNTQTSPECNGAYTFTGLTPESQYELSAYGVCGPENYSASTEVVTAQTTSSDCFAPLYLRTVGIVASDSVTVSWCNSPSSTATYYKLSSGGNVVSQGSCTSDTMTLVGLSESTSYTFSVSNFCTGDTTAWSSVNFTTSAYAFRIPFVCGFENTQQNSHWQLRNLSNGPNWFIIGSSANAVNEGTRALYVTNDGSSYNYSSSVVTGYGVDAEALIVMEAGYYSVEYDWKCVGVGSSDYGRLFLVPASTTIAAVQSHMYNSAILNTVIQTDTRPLQGSSSWTHQSATIEIPEDGIYRMVVIFANSAQTGAQPPLSVDNISVEKIECMPVRTTSIAAITTNSVSLAVRKHEAKKPIQYGFSHTADIDSVEKWKVSSNGYKNDTLLFDSLTANTLYYLYTRHLCDSDSWSTYICDTVHTPAVVVSTPYICSFEQGEANLESWTMTNGGSTNYLVAGNAVSTEGNRSLYVTNDGFSYAYTNNEGNSDSYAYIPLNFTTGNYEIVYDWKCEGEENYDFARLFLAPLSISFADGVAPTGLTCSTLPSGCISLDGGGQLNLSPAWNKEAYTSFNIASDNVYNLVVYWHNNSLLGTQPPFAIDNIKVREISCPRPALSDISTAELEPHSVTLKVTGGASSLLRYMVSTSSQYSDTVAIGTLQAGDSLIAITGLASSSLYYAGLRYVCSDTDSSALTAYRFRTSCEALTLFPYTEGFEEVDVVNNSHTNDVLADMCWMVESTDLSTYYSITLNSSQTHLGSRALYVNNGNTNKSQTFALPVLDSLNGKIFSLYYKNAINASTVVLSIGYLTNPDDASSFVSLYTAPISWTYTEAQVVYNNIPSGARAAFRTTGRYSMCIDDIRINNIVNADTVFETVCSNTGYYGCGFNCPASSLHPGDTTLTRMASSSTIGIADSILTVSLHILNDIINNTNDTICAGEDYIKGYWNLTKPTAGIYFDTYTSSIGCDSTVNLVLTVIPTSETQYDTICQGETYNFYGQTLTAAGTYTGYTLNSLGCADTITLHLFVVDTLYTTSATICEGDSYQFEGNVYTQAGSHTVVRQGTHGCQITKVLNLTVVPADSTVNVSICQGGSIMVIDTVISSAGNHTITRIGTSGCTITYHINATINPLVADEVYDVVCEGYPYSGYGISNLYITQDSVVVVNTRTTDNLCDSAANIHIRLLPTQHTDTTAHISKGESITWQDKTYTTSGEYSVTLFDVNGCDSIVTLHLIVDGTAVENVTESVHIEIIPNPIEFGASAVIYGNFGEVDRVEILNAFGQLVEVFVPSTYPIEMPAITTSGIYYLRIVERSGNSFIEKVIVN